MNQFIDENCNSSFSNSFLKMNQFICLSQINPNELNANSFMNGNGSCTKMKWGCPPVASKGMELRVICEKSRLHVGTSVCGKWFDSSWIFAFHKSLPAPRPPPPPAGGLISFTRRGQLGGRHQLPSFLPMNLPLLQRAGEVGPDVPPSSPGLG